MRMAREAIRNFRDTGAVAPSGRALADRLTEPLEALRASRPARILEVGAGTGAVARHLIGRIGPADTVDLVEFNPRFTAMLTELLVSDPVMAPASDRVTIIEGSIIDVDLKGPYDLIVSGLPFMNFEPSFVRSVMDRLLANLLPGGSLTYYRYLGTTALRRLGGPRQDLARHLAVLDVLAEFDTRHGVGATVVWPNIPPAEVHHLRVPTRVDGDHPPPA